MNRSRDESSSSGVSVASSNGGKSKRNKNTPMSKRPNPNTVETVRMIMEQEGRSARNLVSWSIPLDTYGPNKGKYSKSKQANSQRKRTQSCENLIPQDTRLSSMRERGHQNSGDRPQKKSINPAHRSNSGSRKPVNIRARYWAYLFENLRRAVDEIYATCEGDASVVECKEVLLMLDNYRHDFQALIEWINLQERLENTDIHDRPTSLAWEVRKSSPGRPRQKMVSRGIAPGSSMAPAGAMKINRCLNFSKQPPDVAALANASAVNKTLTGTTATKPERQTSNKMAGSQIVDATNITTWADKVRGVKHPAPVKSPTNPAAQTTQITNNKKEALDKENEQFEAVDDGGDWETVVSRNRQSKHSKSVKNVTEAKYPVPAIKIETAAPCSKVTDGLPPSGKVSHASLQEGAGFVNVVVDRIIGLRGMTSPVLSKPATNGKVPVEFSENCFQSEQQGKTIVAAEKGLSEKIEFQSEEGKDELQDLDAAEADFFKAVHRNNEAKEEKDVHYENPRNKTTKEDNQNQLDKLEEEAASLARTLHAEHDASIAVAEEQERDLLRQIQEVEDAKEQETPEADTDCDSARSSAGAKELVATEKTLQTPLEWSEFMTRFETNQAGLSWNDLVEEEELREPGRAVQMHEKLSSPSRKRTPAESKRKQEEKHRRAEARRLQMHQKKTHKIHELTEKVQVVVSWKNDLIRRQRDLLQSCHAEKLARAEEQRAMQLLSIKKKAQAEDTKVSEIAFINELQEQNKRHEVLMRIGEHEVRIQELEQERTKMQEIKSEKEESVKERRRALEKERQERIEELKVKRKEQDARIEQHKMDKEKERGKLAKERARERELRLSALSAAQQEAVTELQKKIQLKHDESERRHQVQLEQRKEKALELSLGRFNSLTSSLNSPSNSLVVSSANSGTTPAPLAGTNIKLPNGPISGLSDFKGQLDLDDGNLVSDENSNLTGNSDAKTDGGSSGSVTSPRSNAGHTDEESKEDELRMQERMKMMKKRLKKLRSRMSSRGKEFMKKLESKNVPSQANNKNKIVRLIKDVNRLLANQKANSGPWPANRVASLDRSLGEINRILEKQAPTDQSVFRTGGGYLMLENIFDVFLQEDRRKRAEKTQPLPDKSLSNAATTFQLACHRCHDNCLHVLYSNKMAAVVDLTLLQISKCGPSHAKSVTSSNPASGMKKNDVGVIFDVASPSLLSALAVVLYELGQTPSKDAKDNFSDDTEMIAPQATDHRSLLEAYLNRGLDVISYIVASGIMEILSKYLKSIRHQMVPGSSMAAFVKNGLSFLESITLFVTVRNRLLPERPASQNSNRKRSASTESSSFGAWDGDPTQLLPTLQHTELMGIVSVLYGLLLHEAPERPTTLRSASVDNNLAAMTPGEPKQIPEHTLSVALAVMSVLNAVAEMDLCLLQSSLGAEGLSLAFRHICTYLLWYCVQWDHTELLHEVIMCVGYFTLGNEHNQNLVDSGAQPTVLQQLCLLPFSYFSSPPLVHILFPSLIASCRDNDSNVRMLEREASSSLLAGYIQTLLEENEAAGDSDTKYSGNQEEGKKAKLPRSLANASQFSHQFLQGALEYFNRNHVTGDVNANVQTPKES